MKGEGHGVGGDFVPDGEGEPGKGVKGPEEELPLQIGVVDDEEPLPIAQGSEVSAHSGEVDPGVTLQTKGFPDPGEGEDHAAGQEEGRQKGENRPSREPPLQKGQQKQEKGEEDVRQPAPVGDLDERGEQGGKVDIEVREELEEPGRALGDSRSRRLVEEGGEEEKRE